MKKILSMILLTTLILFTACQNSPKSTNFEFGEDLVFVEKNGNYSIDLEKSSNLVKSKYDKISKTLDDKAILEDFVAVTTTTANILNEVGIIPTGAPKSPSLDKNIASLQYELKENGEIDKTKVLNIGSAISPNIEAIIELDPKIVLYSDAMPKTGFVEKLEASEVKTGAIGQSDYIDMFVLLHRINELTEYENTKSMDKMNEMIAALKETKEIVSKAEEGKTVAILQVIEGTTMVNNSETVLGSITETLKIKNVFASSENGELNKEQLLSLNPDYIIYYSTGMAMDSIANFEKELNSEDSIYRELDAVKNSNAFQVASEDFTFLSSVDFDIIKIIKYLAEKFYE
ncbi:MAG: ABC transporter substrate-binding protein [Bacilli bacterium]